jgi:hypothetical protein
VSEQLPELPEPVTGRIPPMPVVGMPVHVPNLRRRHRSEPDPAAPLAPNVAGAHTRVYTRGENPQPSTRRRPDHRSPRRHDPSPQPRRWTEAERQLGEQILGLFILAAMAFAVLLLILFLAGVIH